MQRIAFVFIAGSTTALMTSPAWAAPPHLNPRDANELACNLSPTHDPTDYLLWWDQVVSNPTYNDWFWNQIAPAAGTDACRQAARDAFWNRAVPENWCTIPNIGGWPWASGGYFTQTLWLRAIPQEWAPVANIGGWPTATGGYYTQTFWLRAVPQNWVSVSNIGGWPWSTGGYYTQWLWLRAVPNNWANISNIGGWPWATGGYYTQTFWLRAVPDNWVPTSGFRLGGGTYYPVDNQGYYRYWFWNNAVPDGWAPRYAVPPGGPANGGGYYSFHFWWNAVPNGWAPNASASIDGISNRGYYDTWFYHFATPRGFAAGYYELWQNFYFGLTQPHYISRRTLARGYLDGATTGDPVSAWFDRNALAVVVLTFDTEGNADDSCAVTDVLRAHNVPATFYMVGADARRVAGDSRWAGCLSGFDIGNHTDIHHGAPGFAMPGLFDTWPAAELASEINDCTTSLNATFGVPGESFRTPWCDGHKSFDFGVARRLMDAGILSDSSVATISNFAVSRGLVPPEGLRNLSLQNFPYPFLIHDGGRTLVELPFVYPSDWTSGSFHGLLYGRPPAGGGLAYLMNVWVETLREIRTNGGLMVVLMHPGIESPGGAAGLDYLITEMKRFSGVMFTTATEATRRYRAYRGLP